MAAKESLSASSGATATAGEETSAAKQQFNVYLPPTLIRRAKHAAVDQATSLSRLVELALDAHLDRLEEGDPP
jgi:hypothetical protein